jgi:sugar lactone lactonase YvrE
LSSPWDVVRVDDKIYIAIAGLHQIWVYDMDSKRVRVFAGTGRESSRDGPPNRATFAQPSALVTDGRYLFVADSEASTIRRIDTEDGYTTSVAGSNDLFGYGNRDGRGSAARFQHPLGLALHGNFLYVADTYNNAIRRIDMTNREVTTWLDKQHLRATSASKTSLNEPGGLSIANQTLYIADTNNHRIVTINLNNRRANILDLD